MKLSKMIVPKSMLCAVLAFPGLLMPAFAQQEVDPTWYDPWAAAPQATRPAHAKTEQKKTTQTLKVAKTPAKENQRTQVRATLHRTQPAALQLALK
jgi:hypothetical protein